ncbi:Protein SET-like protein [Dinothrombium tinctorium]|uniref:Protein SET-like protein n=1 Tax=Dinothrombium tinctorium TaxID=1965070 RepID=A0A3S4QF39_9ACAR|nr:Protein SET-like protein [Dinothrombium tinctorium]
MTSDSSSTAGSPEENATSSSVSGATALQDVSEYSGADDDLQKEIQTAVENLECCQSEIESLNVKVAKEILKVKQNYNKIKKPIFDKRNEFIMKIPNFWLTSFMNHPEMSKIIDDVEKEVLQYLTKLEVEEFENINSGYRIKFYFNPNPFFKNEVLVKEFSLGASDQFVSESTQIDFRRGSKLRKRLRDYQKMISKAKKRSKKSEEALPRSFFNWFVENAEDSNDIAKYIKDDLWSSPLQYFLVSDV